MVGAVRYGGCGVVRWRALSRAFMRVTESCEAFARTLAKARQSSL